MPGKRIEELDFLKCVLILSVVTMQEFGTFVNPDTAAAIGVEIPQEIADSATMLP